MATLPDGSVPDRVEDEPSAAVEFGHTTVTSKLRHAAFSVMHASRRGPDGSVARTVLYPLYVLRVVLVVIRQWARDRCPQQASSLAFQTVLSMVPATAIILAVVGATGGFDRGSAFVEYLSRQVIPVSQTQIARYLMDWAGNLSTRNTGLVGVLTTLVLAFFMYASVEQIFNDIWRAEKRRSWGQRFIVFYALFTFVPALLGFSLYHAARYGLTTGLIGALGALGATFVGLFAANKLLPTTRVGVGPAAIGALLSALLFEAAKHLFQLYVAKVAFESYAGVYGTLGLVPILLVWIYYTWLVILLGAEVAHTIQNLHHLESLDRRGRLNPEAEIAERVNGTVATRLLCAVVDSWRHGQKGLTREALATRFDLSDAVVERIFRRLKDHGLVIEVQGETEGFLPARPPSEITLADVMKPFRGSDVVVAAGHLRLESALDVRLAELDAGIDERSRRVTLDELTRTPDPKGRG